MPRGRKPCQESDIWTNNQGGRTISMPSDIQTMMFRIPRSVDLGGTLYKALMPPNWDELFKNIWQSPDEREGPRIPYASLGDSLRLLFPSIAHIARMNRELSRSGWIFSWERPGADQFMALMRAWVRTEGRNRETNSEINGLRWEAVNWSLQELKYGEHDLHYNGSPRLDSLEYDLLPDLACAELAGSEILLGGRPLVFRRAYDGRRPSLISWPAIESSRRGSSSYWSYVLTPRILTSPGYKDPLLSFSPSVRRWASRPLRSSSGYYNLPSSENTTVYVEVPSLWYTGSHRDRGHSLVGLLMKLRAYEKTGGREWKPAWVNPVDEILNRAAAEPRLPDLVELTGEPELFLNRELGSAGITLRNSDTSHPVREGVPLADRRDLFAGISALLEPSGFSPEEPSRRVQVRVRNVSPLRGRKYSNMPGVEVVRSIQRSVGDSIRFEVWYQTAQMKSAIRDKLWGRLLNDSSNRSPQTDRATIDGINIEVAYRELGSLGSGLDKPGRTGEEKRVKEIGREIPVADSPIACIVELHNADHFINEGRGRDPKAAIRRGLATRGYLSQFVTPILAEDHSVGESVGSAVGDLLRQLGNLPGNPFDRMTSRSAFPSDLQLLALWVHRKKGLPIMVHMASPSQVSMQVRPIRVMLPTGKAGGEWYSYPEALLRIGAGGIPDVPREKVRGVLKRMMSEFADSQLGDIPLLMLCDAENMRSSYIWPELQNQNLQLHRTGQAPWNTAGLKPRLARLNVSDEELPDWFGSDAGASNSVPWSSGLFRAPGDNAYYSVGSKSTTMKSGSHKKSKREQPYDNHALTRAKEITLVQLREGDGPNEWANVIHRLRQMAPHFNDALERPLPLHLARLTEEYIPTYGSRDKPT